MSYVSYCSSCLSSVFFSCTSTRGGFVEEEDRCSFTPFQTKKMENWEDQVIYSSPGARVIDVKQELPVDKGYNIYGQAREELKVPRFSWSQILPNSSPRSCVTTSFNSSMLDFSNSSKAGAKHHQLDHSSQEVRDGWYNC